MKKIIKVKSKEEWIQAVRCLVCDDELNDILGGCIENIEDFFQIKLNTTDEHDDDFDYEAHLNNPNFEFECIDDFKTLIDEIVYPVILYINCENGWDRLSSFSTRIYEVFSLGDCITVAQLADKKEDIGNED